VAPYATAIPPAASRCPTVVLSRMCTLPYGDVRSVRSIAMASKTLGIAGSTCERVYRRRNVAGMDLWSSGSVQRAYVPSCEPPPHTSRAIIVLNPRRERHKPKVELGVSLPKGSRVPLFSPVCNHGWESTTICVHHEIAALSSSGSRERTNRLPIFTPQSQDATPKKQKNTSVPNVQLAIGKPCGSTSV
jgi:hypothetical protein